MRAIVDTMLHSLACLLVALAGPGTGQAETQSALAAPLFALDRGTLVASARAPVEGDYRLVIRRSPTARNARPLSPTELSALGSARAENDLWVRWRIDIERFHERELELSVEDSDGVTLWRRSTSSLPVVYWTDPLASSCLAPGASSLSGSLLVAQLDGAHEAWRQAVARPFDCMVAIDDVTALGPGRLDHAREHFAGFLRHADLVREWGTGQLLHLPATGAAQPVEELAHAVRQAWSESTPLGKDLQSALHQQFGELDLFLFDRSEFLEPDAFAATIARMAISTARFKLVVRPGRWFDSRQPERDGAFWQAFLDEVARRRIDGVVLIGSDPRAACVVEHHTREHVGYDLVEVVCGPASAVVEDADAVADPQRMRGSAMPAAFVRVGFRHLSSLVIVLEPSAGGAPFVVDRTSSWLRSR